MDHHLIGEMQERFPCVNSIEFSEAWTCSHDYYKLSSHWTKQVERRSPGGERVCFILPSKPHNFMNRQSVSARVSNKQGSLSTNWTKSSSTGLSNSTTLELHYILSFWRVKYIRIRVCFMFWCVVSSVYYLNDKIRFSIDLGQTVQCAKTGIMFCSAWTCSVGCCEVCAE